MQPVIYNQGPEVLDRLTTYTMFPLAVDVEHERELDQLLADLSPDKPWGDRKKAAKKIGYMCNPEALPGLLQALPGDPFWMVRCAMIQSLEMIGDPGAIPTLREVANSDSFQVVRSHATKAIERLSPASV